MEADFNHTISGPAEEAMMEDGQCPLVSGGNTAELKSVGLVEISDEAMLEDLKAQVGHVCGQISFIMHDCN